MNPSSISTAILLAGLLYMLMPSAVWLVMNKQRTPTVVYWCVGGFLFGAGAILIGMRQQVPPWMSFALANVLLVAGNVLQAQALRIELSKPFTLSQMVGLIAGHAFVYEFLRLAVEHSTWRFVWGAGVLTVSMAYIAYLAWRMEQRLDSQSARWMIGIHILGSAVMLFRLVRVAFGFTDPDAATVAVDTFLAAIALLLASVVGSFSFIGIFFERSVKRDILLAQEQVRQVENARLNAQIAHLDRQRSLGAMSASLSHELNQPLTAILLDTNMVQRGLQADNLSRTELLENIQAIEHNTQRASQIIERIRNFIRPEKSIRQRIDMNVLTREVHELMAAEFRSRHVHFSFVHDAQSVWVMGDPIQLSQVLLNVYRNALQAMAQMQARKIVVRTTVQNNRVEVVVQDTGHGFNTDVMAHVGEAFFTTKAEGLGVGLNISRTIAQQHGGQLLFANAPEGGAQVTLVLPLYATDAPTALSD
jgi:signal transduction histidine kinase